MRAARPRPPRAARWAPPLERIRAAGEALRRQAREAGAARAAGRPRAHLRGRRAARRAARPRRRAAGAAGARGGRRGARRRASRRRPRGVILVVDDNEDNRDMLARRLAREGYEVQTAAGGRAALGAARRRAPVDLVLLDVMMPDLDGYEVLQQLKADAALRDIPVLMISALDEIDSVVRCIELGAEDYLPKPFDPVLLRARIGACLEKKRLRDQEARQRRELAEWNRDAGAARGRAGAQLERLGRLKRFFSPQLAELIVAGGADDPLKTHRREVTVVFLDLRGFTAFAETRRARGGHGRAPRVPRRDGPADPGARRHARALHRRRHDDLLQRSGRGRRTRPSARSAWPSPCATASPGSPARWRKRG